MRQARFITLVFLILFAEGLAQGATPANLVVTPDSTGSFFPSSPPLDPVPQVSTGTLTNTGGTATNFTISVPTSASWLTVCAVTPTGCVSTGTITPGQKITLRITANAGKLANNNYSAIVTIGASSGTGTSFTVEFAVSGISISVTPATAAIAVAPGTKQYFPKQFQVINNLGGSPAAGLPPAITSSNPSSTWLIPDAATDGAGFFGLTVDATGMTASATPLTAALTVGCNGAPCLQPSVTVSVTVEPALTLFGAPSLSFSATTGQVSGSQTLVLGSVGASSLPFTTVGPSWLQVSPSVGTVSTTGTQLFISVDATQLTDGAKVATLTFACTGSTPCQGASIQVNVSVAAATVNQVAAHLADGNGWQTELVLVNNGQVPASYTVNYVADSGKPLTTTIIGQGKNSSFSGLIPVGGSQTLQSDGSPPQTVSGWAQISSMQGVGGLAIFRSSLQPQIQEAAVPLQFSGSPQLIFPYDNSQGSVSGLAIAAPGSSQQQSIAAVQRNLTGQASTPDAPQIIPPNGHNSWVLPTDFPQGVAEIDSPTVAPVFGLGIRFNNFRFTSIEGVRAAPAAIKIVSQVVDGATARTTFLLVNTDTVPASFTINFWADDGTALTLPLSDGTSASSVTGVIPVGGSQIVKTLGANSAPPSVEGWAEVISNQSLGGTAVFAYQGTGQEAAVPLQPRGGSSMVLPFDNGAEQVLGVALANTSTSQDATVTETIRDEHGNQIARRQFTLAHHQHESFLLGSNISGGIPSSAARGVVQYDSDVELYVVGIRYNGGAFTTVRPVNLLQ
jgi:Viral BACON domain